MKTIEIPSGTAKILSSRRILTRDDVAGILGIHKRSAENLLMRWTKQGLLHRNIRGQYVSAFIDDPKRKLQLQSLETRLGVNLLLVGPSSWEQAGWCTSEIVHVAVPTKPSRKIPLVRDTTVYQVGAKQYLHLLKNGEQADEEIPPALHPIAQMLWWMESDCPATMPAPDKIDWEKVRADTELPEAMLATWPDLRGHGKLDVEALYRMIHMDRLTRSISGEAEPLSILDEDQEEEVNGDSPEF